MPSKEPRRSGMQAHSVKISLSFHQASWHYISEDGAVLLLLHHHHHHHHHRCRRRREKIRLSMLLFSFRSSQSNTEIHIILNTHYLTENKIFSILISYISYELTLVTVDESDTYNME
jgi:hypothetical protein